MTAACVGASQQNHETVSRLDPHGHVVLDRIGDEAIVIKKHFVVDDGVGVCSGDGTGHMNVRQDLARFMYQDRS